MITNEFSINNKNNEFNSPAVLTQNKRTYFYNLMELIERSLYSNDWITIVLASCLLLLAIVKWIYGNEFHHLLSAAVSDRYIKVSRNENPNDFLRIVAVIVYIIGLSLWVLKLLQVYDIKVLNFKNFSLILTGVSIFLLVKRYLSMIIASLMGFNQILELIEYHRNTYRAVLGIFLVLLNVFIFYVFPETTALIWIASLISLVIFAAYNFIILYTYSKSLMNHAFYFILYLCTLETAPYLLLYKYFMLLRTY